MVQVKPLYVKIYANLLYYANCINASTIFLCPGFFHEEDLPSHPPLKRKPCVRSAPASAFILTFITSGIKKRAEIPLLNIRVLSETHKSPKYHSYSIVHLFSSPLFQGYFFAKKRLTKLPSCAARVALNDLIRSNARQSIKEIVVVDHS